VDGEKMQLLWRAYRNSQRSFERYPLRPLLPQDWGSQPQPKTAIAIISRTGKATNVKFCAHKLRH